VADATATANKELHLASLKNLGSVQFIV